MVTPAAKGEAVAHLRSDFEVSERRACTVLGVDLPSGENATAQSWPVWPDSGLRSAQVLFV
jgi:hypothetical protein